MSEEVQQFAYRCTVNCWRTRTPPEFRGRMGSGLVSHYGKKFLTYLPLAT